MSTKTYKDTLNLPKTSFAMKANLSQREPAILAQWDEAQLYEQIKAKSKGKTKYILHDGPPYANGTIHMGHVLNKVLKDIVTKYKTMRGFDSFFLPGWDCHGLPIEHQLFKELKMRKDQIDQYAFRQKARNYANRFVNIQREEFKRLGVFGEWKHPYLTMDYEYQAAILEAFKKLYLNGYIYKGEKPIHWCAQCETALAEAELEYNEKVSDSILVRFKVDLAKSKKLNPELLKRVEQVKLRNDIKDIYVLIWTTTPWTLPANVAIAFHPKLKYGFFTMNGDNNAMIFAADLAGNLEGQLGKKIRFFQFFENGDQKGLPVFEGEIFEGLICKHPFIDRDTKVVLAEYVSSTEGTGCVHIAPGHGQEDYQTGLEYNLPLISPVNEKGEFTQEFSPAKGVNVFKANKIVVDILKKNKQLVAHSTVTHSYPHCWRCKKPVIFRATKQWFLNIEHKKLRQRLIDVVNDEQKTKWIPHWGKIRILSMLESRPDWCLSRQRYWGIPIPILYCNSCGKEYFSDEMVSDLITGVKKEGADIWFKLSADKLVPETASCENCGHTKFKKEHDIIDVWFDSGISHQAVLKQNNQLDFPCELYLEGSDQHRGWFQTSLITGVALDNTAPFKTVVTHGFTVDAEGKKMSKSAGNVVVPQHVMKKYGADILRLWVSACDISNDVRTSDDILQQMADAYRKIRNTLRFMLGNMFDFDYKKDRVPFEEMDSVDKWALGKCLLLVKEVTEDYDSFRFHHIYRLIYNFCVVEMSSFYLDILKDRLYTAQSDGRERRSSQTAIFYILRNLVKILAPVLSFTCEEIWNSLVIEQGISSVHLAEWPREYPELIDTNIISDWDRLRTIRDGINPYIEKKREQGIIGSSLDARVEIYVSSPELYKFLCAYNDKLTLTLIVSEVALQKVESLNDNEFDLIQDDSGVSHYAVIIKKASGEKCSRCWNYAKDIGKDKAHPTICPKCIQALRLTS